MGKKHSLAALGGSVLLLGILLTVMLHHLLENPFYYQLGEYTTEEEGFRAMAFGEGNLEAMRALADESGLSLGEVCGAFMVEDEYDLTGERPGRLTLRRLRDLRESMTEKKPVEFAKLSRAYEAILSDAVYFPLPAGDSEGAGNYGYGDSWGAERTYGGERRHEGTDLMDGGNGRGFFPVVSVSDGVVEHVGWLELGGWRIGIRAPGGTYFYYAHLDSYDHEFAVGEEVRAGQLLGFMGDSGYGKVPGTVGNFAVHLHFGIYLRTDHFEELAVNPYWILRFLEEKKVKYAY
ncbi:MAG: M23 family metallopeptidase [Lachnospiraceae bacterium]|nr:M23 family metallopeptidase [Lachnospiraceae bacterium]